MLPFHPNKHQTRLLSVLANNNPPPNFIVPEGSCSRASEPFKSSQFSDLAGLLSALLSRSRAHSSIDIPTASICHLSLCGNPHRLGTVDPINYSTDTPISINMQLPRTLLSSVLDQNHLGYFPSSLGVHLILGNVSRSSIAGLSNLFLYSFLHKPDAHPSIFVPSP